MLRTAPDCPDRLKISLPAGDVRLDQSRSRRSPSTISTPLRSNVVGLAGVRARVRRQHRDAARQVGEHASSGCTPMKPRPPITSTGRDPADCPTACWPSCAFLRATQRPCRCTSDRNRSSDSIAKRPREHARLIQRSSPYMPPAIRRSCSAPANAAGASGSTRRGQAVAASVRGTSAIRDATVVKANRPPGFSQRQTRSTIAAIERHVLGEHADRIDQIEAAPPRTRASPDRPATSRDRRAADAIGVDRMARFVEHRRRRVEARSSARRWRSAPEIAAGAAAEIEHVDRMVEATADAAAASRSASWYEPSASSSASSRSR